MAFKYDSKTYYDCANWVDVAERDMQIYVTLSFVLTFVLPIIFLTISYGAIGRRLMRTQKYWCSYRQTVPFSQHSASRTHSSSSSHNNNVDGNININNNNNNNTTTKTSFIRNKSTRKTVKIKLSNSNGGGGGGGVGCSHIDSNDSTRMNSSTQKSSKMTNDSNHTTSSNNNTSKSTNNNKVIVRFDKRNAEFLNKMRVSDAYTFFFLIFFRY